MLSPRKADWFKSDPTPPKLSSAFQSAANKTRVSGTNVICTVIIKKVSLGGNKVRTRAFAICLLLLLTIVSFTSIMSTQGVGGGEWITNYKVEDPSTGQLMLEVNFETGENRTISSVFAGAELKMTFTVNVAMTASYAILKLKTSLQHSATKDVYWELVSQDYELLAYNPNEQTVQFYQVKGQLVMSLYGRIPITVVKDVPVQYLMVTLYGPAGEILDNIKVKVVTAAMDEYQKLLVQKEDKLQSLKDSGAAPGYIELYENVLNQSKVEAEEGYAENAIALLNTLSVSNEPVSSYVEALFFPAVGILIAVAAVFAFMFIRGRGKLQYVLLVLEDQIRDLEGLTLRASRVDRTLSSSLESVKDRLKSVVGM
jgi:hypothetical protein